MPETIILHADNCDQLKLIINVIVTPILKPPVKMLSVDYCILKDNANHKILNPQDNYQHFSLPNSTAVHRQLLYITVLVTTGKMCSSLGIMELAV